jgi:hypothetical protein
MDTDSRAGFALLSRGGPAFCIALARVSKPRARPLERDEALGMTPRLGRVQRVPEAFRIGNCARTRRTGRAEASTGPSRPPWTGHTPGPVGQSAEPESLHSPRGRRKSRPNSGSTVRPNLQSSNHTFGELRVNVPAPSNVRERDEVPAEAGTSTTRVLGRTGNGNPSVDVTGRGKTNSLAPKAPLWRANL